MKTLTNAELAILTLLAEQSRHGYELEHVIQERGFRMWTDIGFSSIYYLLKKLERDGFISGRVQVDGGRLNRTVYELTASGSAALRTSVLAALSIPQLRFSAFPLGLTNVPMLSPAETHAALDQYRAALAAQLAQVQTRRAQLQPLPTFVDALFDYTEHMIHAELSWIIRFLTQVDIQGGNHGKTEDRA